MQSLTPSARTVERVLEDLSEDLSESSKLLIRDHGETLAAEGRLSLTMDHYYSKNGSMEFEYWYNGVLLHFRTDSGQLLSYLLRYKVTSDKTNHGVVSELQETLEDYRLWSLFQDKKIPICGDGALIYALNSITNNGNICGPGLPI